MDVPGDEAVQESAKSLPVVDVDDVKLEKLSLKTSESKNRVYAGRAFYMYGSG